MLPDPNPRPRAFWQTPVVHFYLTHSAVLYNTHAHKSWLFSNLAEVNISRKTRTQRLLMLAKLATQIKHRWGSKFIEKNATKFRMEETSPSSEGAILTARLSTRNEHRI